MFVFIGIFCLRGANSPLGEKLGHFEWVKISCCTIFTLLSMGNDFIPFLHLFQLVQTFTSS
jgi:hypothetical protein